MTPWLGLGTHGPCGHQVNDPETGLVYMQARYYQPIGRFLSPDPERPVAGSFYSFNRYAYADNDPIGNADPTGKFSANLSAGQKECLIYNCSIQGDGEAARENRSAMAMKRANNALQKAGVSGRGYGQINNLALDWSAAISPITVQMQVEIGSDICLKWSDYFSSLAYSTVDHIMIDFGDITRSIPTGEMLVAEIHAYHDNVGFSGRNDWTFLSTSPVQGYGDLARYYSEQIDGYVALPNGEVDSWSYKKMVKELDDDGRWHYLKDAISTIGR